MIGIFDSGIGGLTVLKALRCVLPHESYVYLGDTARLPYGSKSPDVVKRYAEKCAHFLFEKQVKALVIACNTATAHALLHLQDHVPLPVIGVIEPGVHEALRHTHNKRIAVLATEGTIHSHAYQQAIAKHMPDAFVLAQACPLFVPLIEEGLVDHAATRLLAEEYLAPVLRAQCDTIILGCTHYPLLQPLIQNIVGPATYVINSAEAVANAARSVFAEAHVLTSSHPTATHLHHNSKTDHFYATDLNERFARVGHLFLGEALNPVTWVDL